MLKAFEAVSGQTVPYEVVARRPGDIATCYADSNKAKQLFNWEAKLDLRAMCADTWRWQSNNPRGYCNDR
jgi:UDP-glucose 4-epimerase